MNEPNSPAVRGPLDATVVRPAPKRCFGCDVPNGCAEYCRCIDTADHVRHEPSGEEWLVAYVVGDRVVCCGWPESMARLGDCTLTKKADAKDRDELLMRMAAMAGDDSRARYARRRLAEQAEQEAFRA